MSEEVLGQNVTEITVNTRKLAIKCKSHRKASGAIKNLRRFIQRQWKTNLPVYISTDVNKKIWTNGNFSSVGKIRIRVEKGKCMRDPEQDCLKVVLVDVSSFRNLKDQKVLD